MSSVCGDALAAYVATESIRAVEVTLRNALQELDSRSGWVKIGPDCLVLREVLWKRTTFVLRDGRWYIAEFAEDLGSLSQDGNLSHLLTVMLVLFQSRWALSSEVSLILKWQSSHKGINRLPLQMPIMPSHLLRREGLPIPQNSLMFEGVQVTEDSSLIVMRAACEALG